MIEADARRYITEAIETDKELAARAGRELSHGQGGELAPGPGQETAPGRSARPGRAHRVVTKPKSPHEKATTKL